MRLLIAALFASALIWVVPTETPVNKVVSSTQVQTVRANLPEKEVQDNSQEKALMEPQVDSTGVVSSQEEEPASTPQVSHPTGCENYRQLIGQYDWNVDTFLNIAQAESGCNPSEVGDEFTINGLYAPSCGLFQVRTLSSRPSCEALKDPATNIAWAYRIYQGQGYGAWSVCSYKVNCM